MPVLDRRVDEQIEGAPDFAREVMRHLRELVLQGCPAVEETIKWGRPFFLYRGKMLCYVAAFTRHCGFGFVGPGMRSVMEEAGMPVEDASGSIGRIVSVGDLPSDAQMLAWIRQAAALVDGGAGGMRRVKKERRPEIEMPAELAAALKRVDGAMEAFAGFSASCRREYVEWITEAKRPETRGGGCSRRPSGLPRERRGTGSTRAWDRL